MADVQRQKGNKARGRQMSKNSRGQSSSANYKRRGRHTSNKVRRQEKHRKSLVKKFIKRGVEPPKFWERMDLVNLEAALGVTRNV